MSMTLVEILCQPIVCGLAMALVSWLILDFWQDILTVPHKKLPRKLIKIIIALINGGFSFLAEIYTQNNASPRTIALYLPIMITLEIHILGHMKNKWGSFSVFALTSFQFITLYSVSLGVTNLVVTEEFLNTRFGLILPVTLLNLILSIFLGTLKLYKISLKENHRDYEIGEILDNPKSSLALIVYACINAIVVTVLTYDAISMLSFKSCTSIFTTDICRNMILRDTVLFFSTIMMLDFQSRNAKNEKQAKDMIAKNILLERDMQTQSYVQMGLEAAKKELEEKNKQLSQTVEYEKNLRKKLHRNILFRFSCNVTKGKLDDAGALKIDPSIDVNQVSFDDVTKLFTNSLVHPDYSAELIDKLSLNNLNSIAYTDKGFKVAFKMSPQGFINSVTLDDDSAKIYAYADRDYIWTDMDCTVVIGEDGDTYAYFYIMDIDEQKQKEEVIIKAATTDGLTGLENRNTFRYNLNNYLSTEGNKGGALFMFDLDYFKSVNDNLGHPKGDELLKDVADILTSTFRSDDLICRIGGDEFCAFAKGFTDNTLIIKRAEALNEAGRKTFDLPNGDKINVSFSIGIAVIPGDANDAKELYTNADSALYRAKESGRNCYKLFSE